MRVPKQVLVAERDPEALRQVSGALRAAGYATWEASTGREALRFVQMDRPDLAVVGLVLPDIGGRDLARILRSNGDSEPIETIVLAAPGVAFEETLTAGGAPEQPVVSWSHVDEVVTRVNEVFDLSAETDPERFSTPVRIGDIRIDPTSNTVQVGDVAVPLTKKEFRFLQVLALNEERTCTRDELRRLVWGTDADVIGRTIDVLVSRLRTKLCAATGRELVSTVRGIGYRFAGQGGST
jgi:DNA-binding response OmpR family regulator